MSPAPGGLRLLTFSTLFPDSARPNHGVFVENRLRHLVATGEASSTVLAPVPWFPFSDPRFGEHAKLAGVPAVEERHGLTVHHPRYLVIPKVGMSVAPALLYLSARLALRRMDPAFDAIDAHYVYPDGVAAVWLGAALGKPVVITARGSDVTQLPDHALPRAQIRMALRRAAALIGVSAALCRRMVELGADPGKVTTLRNGVDTHAFHPVDRAAARGRLGLTRRTLISVGHLIERKRNHLTIAAMPMLPDTDFILVGDGPERGRLEAQARALGVAARVRFLGAQPHHALAEFYGAADAMVLASSREGWANVLLESMACGTPVVASDIPGNDEVVQAPAAGRIVAANTPEGIAAAVTALFAAGIDRAATRDYAAPYSWDATSAGQLRIFRRVIAAHRG